MLKRILKRKRIILVSVGIVALLICGLSLYKFYFNKDIQLKTEEKTGNINILILGKGGGKHEGPDLTDTIIVATINPNKNSVNLISIPRDLWVPDLQAKVNTAYTYGQEKGDQGKLLAKTIVGKITGKQIDYVLVIDFSAFINLIDHLGGIDVNVRRALDDYQYPLEGKEDDPCDHTDEEIIDLSTQIATGSASETDAFPCRYKHIHYDQGIQHMNGQQALEFVRSRHGLNGEGSDFARSQRQQDVIDAIQRKAFSLGIILNPIKVIGAFNIVKDNLDTNAQLNEIDDFINLAGKMQNAKITSAVIDIGSDEEERKGLLIHPPISSQQRLQWVLIPRVGDGNFTEITDYIKCIEEGFMCEIGEENIIKRDVSNN
jgi:LCP family protein required for cell wall assembly